MQLLDDHVVLITGGGSGLGLGVARQCLAEGAQVAIMEIAPDKVEHLVAEFGDRVLIRQGDVRSVTDLEALRAAIVERYGRLDALIGCQGIFDGNLPLRETPVDRIDSLFDELFHVNVKGYILSARVFVDLLEENDGAIVLTSSTAAYAADGGGLFYSASKGAVRSVVNQLAFEFAPRIRVNGVAPSGIANSQLQGPAALGLEKVKQSDIPKEDFLEQFRMLAPLQHLPTPEEYGWLYAFLASRRNTLMTGQTIVADQGLFNRAVISFGSKAGGIPVGVVTG
ncbi:SDR family oxidoreductase [Georgenia yuyongxinii]|uniref:SDR family oxidoreductase n=1 Tax=Georgenia yuyongxinii TaxID=2589797 RepID=A0A552WXG3_9MICO|nr:SDR family oxidoreductase [Georgenia yuyongxinii]TRW47464.1 SDR family oxidoreductase [Georgenia yuyongxinii]